MAENKNRAETSAERARKLRWCVDSEMPVPPMDLAWLKAYEAAEVKRQAKAMKVSDAAVKKSEAKAKKEGRVFTLKDVQDAVKPATPSTRGRKHDPVRVLDHANVLAVAIENHEVETLAMATALAFGSLPRIAQNREVRKLARMGLALWVVVTYAPKKKRGGGIMFGSDSLALIALTEMARQGASRLEFDSMAALLTALDGKQGSERHGGKQKELAFERLRRVRNTAITITFYGSEEDARKEANPIRELDVTVIHDFWNPFHEETRGEQPLFKPWLQINPAFNGYVREPKALTYLPTDLVHAFVGHPLKLQFAMWLYPRAMGAKTITCVPMDELQEQFGEGREARKLIRDLQIALDEIQAFYQASGRRLHVRFVQGEEVKSASPKGGRPSKTWFLEIGPSDKLTGAKGAKTLKG